MRDDGFTYLEISDFLNNSKYKPQSTKKWTMPIRNWGIILNKF